MDDPDLYPDLFDNEPETLESYINPKRVPFKPETLINPVADPHSSIGITKDFASSTKIVHFGGFTVGEAHVQEITIVNRNTDSKRMQILPLQTNDFKLEYTLSGIMAPGMSQKIKIHFNPKEYKYHYDCIRVNGGENYLLIPLHAYPVVNQIDFPRVLAFGDCPLTEPISKSIVLQCTIPVDFSYKLEVVRPHPYFSVVPMQGIIPANGNINIKITFLPITLGSCAMTLRLHVSQHQFEPLTCLISGRAVSGLLENTALDLSHTKVLEHLQRTGNATINSHLYDSTFKSDLKSKNELFLSSERSADDKSTMSLSNTRKLNSTKFLAPPDEATDHFDDPTALMLSSSFRASNIATALDGAVKHHGHPSSLDENVHMRPRGPGSGSVFDAGTQLMSTISKRKYLKQKELMSMGMSIAEGKESLLPPPEDDKKIEGLRVPPSLADEHAGHALPGVNFVITQEIGKLKPKDLKVAIEKNREEKAKRAEEQRKMREIGGGAGMLDLNSILAEERMNDGQSDSFKRQLRELAFLADVDDLRKQEAEKQFRVSEEFLGSTLLSDKDVEIVMKQRKISALHARLDEWRRIQNRDISKRFMPKDLNVKAGAPAEMSKKLSAISTPSYDVNRNDIWSKRMNTLRRFMGLVSCWLVRKRLDTRMDTINETLRNAGITNKEEARAWIAQENEDYKLKSGGGGQKAGQPTTNNGIDSSTGIPTTLPEMMCALPNDEIDTREKTEEILEKSELDPISSMVRRVLFPRFQPSDAATRSELPASGLFADEGFNDRTYYQVKIKPEYVTLGYRTLSSPTIPLFFSKSDNESRQGAMEENALREAVDKDIKRDFLLSTADTEEKAEIDALDSMLGRTPGFFGSTIRAKKTDEELEYELKTATGAYGIKPETTIEFENDIEYQSLAWLKIDSNSSKNDRDFFSTRPNLRCYMPTLMHKESDIDWHLRPGGTQLVIPLDESTVGKLMQNPGFTSAHTYLLNAYESKDERLSEPMTSLSDGYVANLDRHRSGMYCFKNENNRSLYAWDLDVRLLQRRQDHADYLTDSESDEEDYQIPKPSLERVRSMLTKNEETTTDPVAEAVADEFDGDDFDKLEEKDKKRDQVELMRDRKILEMETIYRKQRDLRHAELSSKLTQLSEKASCLLDAIPVQHPFHTYSEEVYKEMDGRTEYPLQRFIVEPVGGVHGSTLIADSSLLASPPNSPIKKTS